MNTTEIGELDLKIDNKETNLQDTNYEPSYQIVL